MVERSVFVHLLILKKKKKKQWILCERKDIKRKEKNRKEEREGGKKQNKNEEIRHRSISSNGQKFLTPDYQGSTGNLHSLTPFNSCLSILL